MEVTIAGSVFVICMTLFEIFRRKYKKDMFVEYLKHDDSPVISDDVIVKLFNLYDEEK